MVDLGRTFPLERASEFLYRTVSAGSRGGLLLHVVLHPIEAVGVVVVLSQLPRLTVRLTSSRNGASLRDRLGRRLLGVRASCFGQAVLLLPPSFSEYIAGRSRRAVRTNVSRARASGLLVRSITDTEEQERLTREVEARRPPREWWVALGTRSIRPPDLEWFGVFDSSGRVLGVAAVAADREWAHLLLLTCVTDDELASSARYLLHTEILRELIEGGVRYLLSDSGMRVAPGVRYLQHVLGYAVVNLRVDPQVLPCQEAAA